MATPYFPESTAILLPDGSHHVTSNIPQRHQLQRNVKLSIYFKFIELLMVLMSLVLHSQGGQLNLDPIKLALTYGTFGAYIIVPLFLMAGFIIGEVTPKLLVGYNLFGACLFILVGAIGFDTYWNLEQNLGQLPLNWDISGIENVNNLTLGSAILCLLNALLYAIDTVIEGVIIYDSQ